MSRGVDGDVVAVKPRVDLKPGEYALAVSRSIRAIAGFGSAFDFGMPAADKMALRICCNLS